MKINQKLVALFFSIIGFNSYSQELVPFYDKVTMNWGFQDKLTQKIIIQPQFEDAVEWWKDYGIVMVDNKYGLIDKEGKKVSPFILDYLAVEHCADCRKDELIGYYYYESDYQTPRKFYVNTKCDCIPFAYYPCPPQVKMDTSNTPQNLKYIQRAEFCYHQGDIKKALEIAEDAIEADTNDASTYFWKASLMADNQEMIIMEDPFYTEGDLESELSDWEKEFELRMAEIDKASALIDGDSNDEIESKRKELNNEDSLIRLNYSRRTKSIDSLRKYYSLWEDQSMDYWNVNFDSSYHLLNYYNAALRHEPKRTAVYYSILTGKMEIDYLPKSERKDIKKEIVKNTSRLNRKGENAIMINPGYAIFPYQKAEINITYGFSELVFSSLFPRMIGIGLGYEKGLDLDVDNYKAILMVQPVGPIHLAINLMYVKGIESGGFGFRPEFGFSFSALTILYGFNFVSDSKFPGARGNMVGVRLNLPVWRPNSFSSEFGNNLYR